MTSRNDNLVYVNSDVLARVEARLGDVLHASGATALLLIERSGAVLATAGDPPLHPDEMGALAAGIYGAMKALVKATRAEDFVVRLPQTNMGLQFRQVDGRLFLCAFYTADFDEQAVREGMADLAAEAVETLKDQTSSRRSDLGAFIEGKLNEIFGDHR